MKLIPSHNYGDIKQLAYEVYGQYKRDSLRASKRRFLDKNLKHASITSENGLKLRAICEDLYTKYGLKVIARELGITYTDTRSLFSLFNLEIRKGQSVVTEELKKFRKKKAIRERTDGTGFADPEVIRKCLKHISRGVQGPYYNSYKDKDVWLRSTYEWIFAKWLDKTNHLWDSECRAFKIDSRYYRPDFFIYDSSGTLKKIIEIKGYWDNNSDKASILNEQLKDIEVIIITDITKYIEAGKTYFSELNEWKKINGKN